MTNMADMEKVKQNILLEILNERMFKKHIIDEDTRNKILSLIWK